MENYELEKNFRPNRNPGVVLIKKRTVFLLVSITLFLLVAVALVFYFIPHRSAECSDQPAPVEHTGLPPIPEDEPDIVEPTYPFDGRLPNTFVPEHYSIWMKVYMDQEDESRQFSYDGEINITMKCTTQSTVIKVHYWLLDVDFNSIEIYHMPDMKEVGTKHVSSDDTYHFLVIESEESLNENEIYMVMIRYIGELREYDLYGFYRSQYIYQDETRFIAVTCFQPTGARNAFPCLDEPQLKATFDISITHRPNRKALSCMPVSMTTSDGEWNTTYFSKSVVMSTYHVAFALLDFPSLEKTTDTGIQFRVWAEPDQIHAAEYALNVGVKMLTFFERYFNLPHPIRKMDMVASPTFISGGLENWALIVYQDAYMLYDPDVNTPAKQKSVASIIAHELAHMWYGNIVTMSWWDHLWLNEGFASFLEYVALDEIHPEWKIWDQFLTEDLLIAFNIDSSYSAPSLVRSSGGWTHQLWDMFDTITYDKGAAIIRTFKSFLSDDVIRSGINENYLMTNLFGDVVTDDLWYSLAKADADRKGTDVKAMMDSWVLQPGFPLLTATRTGTHTIKLEQTRFILDSNEEQPSDHPKWNIPLTYTHGGEKHFDSPEEAWFLADRQSETLVIEALSNNEWYILNINQNGYYRVNYDTANWERLAHQLNNGHQIFPTQTRASLIDDALTVSKAGYLDHVYGLQLTEYMAKEFEYVPWKLLLGHLPFTHRMLLRKSEYGLFEKYWRNQISPLYSSLGWNFTHSSLLDYYQRVNAINTACNYGNSDCIDEATRLYAEWMDNPMFNPIRDELKLTVYCTSIKYGGVKEWQFAYDQVTWNGVDQAETVTLELAMGCSRDGWLLQSYLERYHGKNSTLTAIGNIRDKSGIGFTLAWQFAMMQFEELLQKFDDYAYIIVFDFHPWMNTEYDLKQLLEFGARYWDMPGVAAREFYKTINKVKDNIKWMDRNRDGIRTWLSRVTNNTPNSGVKRSI
ncbi:aminopeptidase N-like [Saccoglossus kowalevskii]|uniref:Aminopeptidase n=1 Tax=Saccoglossus kowalevskii TaxID=10224 RepID=A0ABM0MJZ5_SACKO|nr:PREDICTED: aminopeptidase N-like [Saccoglossus kowalevskii]